MPADFKQLCHGYVLTSHKAQALTADHAAVAVERFTSKGAYVALARPAFVDHSHPEQGAPDRKIA